MFKGKEQNVGKYDVLINEKEIRVNDTSILPELTIIRERKTDGYNVLLALRMVVRGEDKQDELYKIFYFCSNSCLRE